MATGVFMLGQIQGLLMTMRLWDALDILVVAFFFYRMYILVRDTRATALLKGLVFLGLFTLFAGWLQLHVVSWITYDSAHCRAPCGIPAGTPPCSGTAWPRQILYFFPHHG